MTAQLKNNKLIVIVLAAFAALLLVTTGFAARSLDVSARKTPVYAAAPAKIYIPNPRVKFAPVAGRRTPAQLANVEAPLAGGRRPAQLANVEAPLAGRKTPAPLATSGQNSFAIDIVLLATLVILILLPARKEISSKQ